MGKPWYDLYEDGICFPQIGNRRTKGSFERVEMTYPREIMGTPAKDTAKRGWRAIINIYSKAMDWISICFPGTGTCCLIE